MSNTPLFSILHTSARPNAWRAVYEDWLSKADNPELVEYVLVVDKRWGFEELPVLRTQDKVLWNVDRKCYVEGVNIAARAATGKILIVNADDQFAAHCWDTDILALHVNAALGQPPFPSTVKDLIAQPYSSFVIWGRTGTRDEVERGIIVMPIVSRDRFERNGYIFYPGYESMYADNDLCAHAKQDGVIIDAPELMFPHRHPLVDKASSITGGDWDEAYREQNRAQAYSLGEKLFQARKACKFQEVPKFNADAPLTRKTIAFCLPGDSFPAAWVTHWTEIFAHLSAEYNIIPTFCQSSNVYVVRAALADAVLRCAPRPDYVVWIDSDNLVRTDQIRQLIRDIDEHPEISVVSGWCHCLNDVYRESGGAISGGTFDGKNLTVPMALKELIDSKTDLVEWDYTGFPLVVMPLETLQRVGKEAFAPISLPAHPWGFHGEDSSFSKRVKDSGGRLFVDRRIRVPHLKLRAAEPVEARIENRELVNQ